jgi:hypothetical protein
VADFALISKLVYAFRTLAEIKILTIALTLNWVLDLPTAGVQPELAMEIQDGRQRDKGLTKNESVEI